MTNQSHLASPEELESAFQLELATDKWAAAETSYALALLLRDSGESDRSREWATKCLELLAGLPTDSLSDVAPRRHTVGGISLPNYLHEGVVRDRFNLIA